MTAVIVGVAAIIVQLALGGMLAAWITTTYGSGFELAVPVCNAQRFIGIVTSSDLAGALRLGS